MRTTIVSLVDDLDGTVAAETVTFGIDDQSWEIDLSEANAAALRRALAPWIAKARPAGTAGLPVTRHTTVLPAVGGSRAALIRAWAAATGRAAPARGRIPQGVAAAYDAATK